LKLRSFDVFVPAVSRGLIAVCRYPFLCHQKRMTAIGHRFTALGRTTAKHQPIGQTRATSKLALRVGFVGD